MAGIYGFGGNKQAQLCLGVKGGAHTEPASGVLNAEVTELAAGSEFGLALMQSGAVKAWGGNQIGGQLGDGTRVQKSTPVMPPMPEGLPAFRISAGGISSMALLSDRTVATWGANNYGNLGNGESERWNQKAEKGEPRTGELNVLTPTRIGLSSVSQILMSRAGTAGAVFLDGTIAMWGENRSGQIGDGTKGTEAEKLLPTVIEGVTNARKLSCNGRPGEAKSHTLCLRFDGTVMAWGSGAHGELGNGKTGTAGNSVTPIVVPGLTEIVDVGTGSMCSFAVKANGDLYAFGYNKLGQCGTGAEESDITTPTVVLKGAANVVSSYTADESGVSGGFTLVGMLDGSAYGMGDNRHGQLGDGTLITKFVPTKILVLDEVLELSAGEANGLALSGPRASNRLGQAVLGIAKLGHLTENEEEIEVTGGVAALDLNASLAPAQKTTRTAKFAITTTSKALGQPKLRIALTSKLTSGTGSAARIKAASSTKTTLSLAAVARPLTEVTVNVGASSALAWATLATPLTSANAFVTGGAVALTLAGRQLPAVASVKTPASTTTRFVSHLVQENEVSVTAGTTSVVFRQEIAPGGGKFGIRVNVQAVTELKFGEEAVTATGLSAICRTSLRFHNRAGGGEFVLIRHIYAGTSEPGELVP